LADGSRRDSGELQDIEDLCGLCAPFEEAAEQDDDAQGSKQSTSKSGIQREVLSPFFGATRTARARHSGAAGGTLETIINHAKKFPFRKPKKKVREEETLVCAIRRSDGRYLIHRRPDKGLLAGMWEFSSHILPESNDSTAKSRKTKAVSFISGLVAEIKGKAASGPALRHLGELGSVPWLFSHLKLTMHVHLFELDGVGDAAELGPDQQWASNEDIERESMGTGMRKSWALVKEAAMD
jgi:A/G-specific adenine glycosylase